VDVGLMAGLWVLLAVAQLYFYVVVSSYGAGQRLDHEKYDSMENSFASVEQITADKPYDPYGGPSYPSEAFAQEPNPTSHVQDSYYSSYNPGGSMPRPEMEEPRSAEGSFRRKASRLQKPISEDFRIP